MSVSDSKRREVFHRAGGRCQCTLAGCRHPIDHAEALRRASGTIAVGPIGATLLSSFGDRCARSFSYPDSLLGDLVRGWEVDHITPVSMGGSDDVGNLQLLCKECHQEKTGQERSIASVNA